MGTARPLSRTVALLIGLGLWLVTGACGQDQVTAPLLDVSTGPSVVTVLATGCGERFVSGVGFFVDAGLVMTAGHVVAGADAVVIEKTDGVSARAVVVELDARRDIAVLSVAQGPSPLALAGDRKPDEVVIMRRDGSEMRTSVERLVILRGPDIYMGDLVDRLSLQLADPVGLGMSGAPVVDGDSRVAGMVVASSSDHGYAVAASELRIVLANPDVWEADAGGCAVNETYDCTISNPSAAVAPRCSSPSLWTR